MLNKTLNNTFAELNNTSRIQALRASEDTFQNTRGPIRSNFPGLMQLTSVSKCSLTWTRPPWLHQPWLLHGCKFPPWKFGEDLAQSCCCQDEGVTGRLFSQLEDALSPLWWCHCGGGNAARFNNQLCPSLVHTRYCKQAIVNQRDQLSDIVPFPPQFCWKFRFHARQRAVLDVHISGCIFPERMRGGHSLFPFQQKLATVDQNTSYTNI